MSIFITGSTGYIGSYVVASLLTDYQDHLNLLIRADSEHQAQEKLWKALQLHFSWDQFQLHLKRCSIFIGDITQSKFGLKESDALNLVDSTNSIIHIAASLNRKSENLCLKINLKGTLEVIKFANIVQKKNGLRRFSDVSTVAVAGNKPNQVIDEDSSISWETGDFDPYARTKKFSEQMINELLTGISTTIFRPSIVLGDSKISETTQFDMARAFAFFTKMPILPLDPNHRIDIVPVDFVANSIVKIHQKESPTYKIYHLSSGLASPTFQEISTALHKKILFVPILQKPFSFLVNAGSQLPKHWSISKMATLIKVFLPYIQLNTVFDNHRIVDELGVQPPSFTTYGSNFLRYVNQNNFNYPYKNWPQS